MLAGVRNARRPGDPYRMSIGSTAGCLPAHWYSQMWYSPLFWIAVAVTVFWALGAYNRLMRLRSAVVQAFGGLDAHMLRVMALLGEFASARMGREQPCGEPCEKVPFIYGALEGASVQFGASLAVARARPLRADALAALSAARSTLDSSWNAAMTQADALPASETGCATINPHEGQRRDADASDDAAQAPAVEDPPALLQWQIRWSEHALHCNEAVEVFNDAVDQYNDAITQFPASLLARICGFQTARGL